MAITVKAGTETTWGFGLFAEDAITRVEGAAAEVIIEIWHSDRDGNETLVFAQNAADDPDPADILVEVAETARHDYKAIITWGDAAPGDYRLTIRHEESVAEVDEVFQLFTSDIDDVRAAVEDLALETGGYLVGIEGVPAAAGDAFTVTVAFHNRATMGLISPSAVASIRLYDTDGTTLLQTKSGGDITTPSLGKRRATFAAVESPGRYFVCVTFTGVAGSDPITEYLPADITSSGAGVVAGVMSVEDLIEDYLGALDGEVDAINLLEDDSGRSLVSNRYMESAIRRAAAYVSRVLETTFGVLRYACNPTLGTVPLDEEDYDAEVEALPWMSKGQSDFNAGLLTLKHGPLVRITRMRTFLGQDEMSTVPVGWAVITSKKAAQISIMPNGASEMGGVLWTLQGPGQMLAFDWRPNGKLPAVWAIDYEAGLATVPEDVKAAIGWRAAADVLAMAAVKANKAAVGSKSVSMDGVSRSQSTQDSQPGGRYSRLLQTDLVKMWTDPTDAALLKLKSRAGRDSLLL
jgi:hypothetical protein